MKELGILNTLWQRVLLQYDNTDYRQQGFTTRKIQLYNVSKLKSTNIEKLKNKFEKNVMKQAKRKGKKEKQRNK